jgi:predicted lipoprotein with Yx(FWY)xxD motif
MRNRTLLAWLLFVATFGCLAGGLVVTLFVTRPLTADALVDGAFEASTWLLFATIGLVLTLRRPANPIGWLYAAAALAWTAYVPWDPWVDQLLRTGRPLPSAAHLAALAGDNLWAVGLTLAITLPLLLLPDGRLRSRRWRPVVAAAVAGTTMEVVGWVLSPDPLTQTLRPVAKPFALHGVAGTVATTVSLVGWAVLFVCIPAAAVCVVLRFRASSGVERQQLRWVAAGAATATAAPAAAPAGLKLAQSKLGQVLTDDKGHTLYAFTPDQAGESTCYDTCAQTWPPLLTQAAPMGAAGVTASLVGTTTRRDGGKQATYKSWPLYYYAGDQQPGDLKGQGVGGNWFVVGADGSLVKQAGGSAGGGYKG